MTQPFRSQPLLRWLASLLLLGSLCSLISLAPPRLAKLLPARLLPASKRPNNNDPIGFTLRADKTNLRLGETLRLTITARHLNIPASLLFTTEDATAYRLKLLLPEGFVVTGGSFRDFIEGQLKPGQAPAVYTLEGYFSQVPQQARFRLLRGNAQANEQSLFVDKAQLTLDVRFDPALNGRVAAAYSACIEAESGSGNRSLYADGQASGGQAMGGFGNASEYMSYSVNSVPAAGSYSLQLSYVSGDAQAVMGVVVNGGTVQTVSAPGLSRQTGPYGQASLNVSLNAGSNTIRIQGSGQGGFNLDRFCLAGGGCSSAPSLVLGTPSCTGSSVYSVGFTAQSGATVTASAGSVQGSSVVNVPVGTKVVVTASQGSCSTQQTANSPTSCGTPPPPATMAGGFAEGSLSELTALAPFVPDNNQVSSWAALTPQFISNGQIKYGIHNSIGATGFWLSEDNANPKNLINASGGDDNATPSTPGKWDKGRALFYSVYGTPRGSNQDIYYQGGQETGNPDPQKRKDDTGWNPNMGGDQNFHSSPILFYQRKTVAGYGEVLYAQVQPYHWSMDQQLAEVKTHCWYWLEGKFLRYFVIIDNFRTDTQRKYEGREQEGIAMYVLATMFHQRIYTGPPKAGQGATEITTPIVPTPEDPGKNQSDTGPRLTSECWMSCSDNSGANTLVLFTPYNSCFKGKQFLNTGDDNYVSSAASYMDASLYTDMDNSGTTAYSGYVYVGSEANFRSWYNSSSVALRPFKFNFNSGKRQGWASVNGRFIRENGNMVFYIGDSHTDNGVTSYSAKLVSPTGSWPSSSLSTLYVNLTFSGTLNLDVSWLKPGQTDANTGAQTKQVTLTGNGSPQTYAIQMGGNGWDGTISQISLSPQNRNNPGISTLRPNWISDTNQAPN